jgi:hypothetical protein
MVGLGLFAIPLLTSGNGVAIALGVVVGVAWTAGAIWLLARFSSPSYYEKARWERQEATRLRKKEWREGRKP